MQRSLELIQAAIHVLLKLLHILPRGDRHLRSSTGSMYRRRRLRGRCNSRELAKEMKRRIRHRRMDRETRHRMSRSSKTSSCLDVRGRRLTNGLFLLEDDSHRLINGLGLRTDDVDRLAKLRLKAEDHTTNNLGLRGVLVSRQLRDEIALILRVGQGRLRIILTRAMGNLHQKLRSIPEFLEKIMLQLGITLGIQSGADGILQGIEVGQLSRSEAVQKLVQSGVLGPCSLEKIEHASIGQSIASGISLQGLLELPEVDIHRHLARCQSPSIRQLERAGRELVGRVDNRKDLIGEW